MQKGKSKYRFFKAGGLGVVLLAVFCAGIFLSTISLQDFVEDPLNVKRWHHLAMAEANPGAGASGVLRQLICANGVFPYTANITVNASVYAAGQTNNTHINSTVPYGSGGAHDIYWKVRFNTSHAYNSTSAAWELALVRGNITCAGHTLSDQGMDEYEIANNTQYIWVAYVWDGTLGAGGTGLTITRGQNITSVLISCDAYY